MALDLIGNMLDTYIFDELRNKQRLGYHALAYTGDYNQLRAVFIELQSECNPMFLTQQVNQVLANFKKHIDGVEVDEMILAAVSRRLGKFNSTAEEGYHYWGQIYSDSYEFDILENEAAALQGITKEYLLEVWDRYFNSSTYTRIDLQSWVKPPSIDELEKYPEAIISLYRCLEAKNTTQYSLDDLQQMEDKWDVHPSKSDPRVNTAIQSAIESAQLPPGNLRTPEGKIIINDVKQFQAAQKAFDLPLLATTATPKY
ncbi:metalloprotease [Coemansia sp. RSA 1250]|nr:metalloprotease [Coemansia sp. RSA 1250]